MIFRRKTTHFIANSHCFLPETPGKDPGPIVQEAGCAPGPVWTGAENLAPTGTRSPDRPARSESLYWLSYPAHKNFSTYRKTSWICAQSELLFFPPRTDRWANVAELVLLFGIDKTRQSHEPWQTEGRKKAEPEYCVRSWPHVLVWYEMPKTVILWACYRL
jgi:hypothetical protein